MQSDYLLKNKAISRNSRVSHLDSENISNNRFSTAKRETCFNSVRLSQDKRNNQSEKNINNPKNANSRCKKESTHRNYLSKHNISQNQDMQYKVRAASSSLNRKGEDRFLFRPPTHGPSNIPTPKNRQPGSTTHARDDDIDMDLNSKVKKELDSSSKIKRSSLHRVKRVNKIPLGKRDINSSNNPNRSTSRSKQLSAKNRLVYKKDSMKTLNSNSIKNEMSIGVLQPPSDSKFEDKENDFTQANNNLKLNRTSSGRDTQKNIKSMSGIRKLYTLKANNSSRRLESQSYRDLNYKQKTTETVKNPKILQSTSNIYSTSISGKKRHVKNKVSSSETPKLRSHTEAMFTGITHKTKNEEIGDKENQKPNSSNYTANYDTRLLRKPPNPNAVTKQVKATNLLKKPNSHEDQEERK